ncbi:hypothetical protein [Nocardia stercoris]|uniref:Uncharacterized protein n=1 Tax=Nocardia stercoris TaxID=2483361 RepID=A0A3M2KWK9_9NOCA|nr:hypothetical protein [Nocardia stercoris]RMI29016.1 hypothetical protein EBN03_28230 [Nocardia stercoris]
MLNNVRRTGPVAVFATAAAGLVLAAPHATANTITDFTVTPGLGNGYGTGCSYQVSATVEEDAAHVILLDNGWQPRNGPTPVLSGNTITWTWIPAATGQHTLEARYDDASQTVTVEVGNGINLGSACVVH